MSFEEVKKLDDTFIMHTFKRKPVCLVEGKGVEVTDDEGKTYLDFIAGIGVDSLGHCHPAVVKAITEQAEKLIHVSNYYYIEKRAEVAKQISDMANECVPRFFRAPWRTFFANSGAEANECAIKLARLWAKKESSGGHIIVVLEGSFHGRTLATLAATAQPAKQEKFAPLPEGFVAIPPNDMDALRNIWWEYPGQIAAIMMEPIQGEAGVLPVDHDYLFEATKLARRNGALFIADEVQTGFYRCGTWPFEFQNAGITPDIITFAKGVASGMPTGGCVARIEVAEVFEPGDHGSTFGGSNLAMAAAHATLDTLSKENFGQRVEEMGDYFADKLLALDEVTDVRGSGLMIAADLKDEFKASFVVDAALDAGFLLNATGEHTLRFLPPLIITEAEIDKLIDALPSLCVASKTKEKEAAEAEQKAKEQEAAAQQEYEDLLKEAENINAEFKDVMQMLKEKVGSAEGKLGDALQAAAAEKLAGRSEAASADAAKDAPQDDEPAKDAE